MEMAHVLQYSITHDQDYRQSFITISISMHTCLAESRVIVNKEIAKKKKVEFYFFYILFSSIDIMAEFVLKL